MKQFQTIIFTLLLAVLASLAQAGESKRGFFEANLSGGGRIVFFVQANHSLSAYIFNVAGQQASFAGGPITDNGTFNLTTSANQSLTGTVTSSSVTATFLGQNITANRVPAFGPTDDLAGRYTATARSSAGAALDVKIVIDSQGNIFLVTKQGSTVLGGFGQVTILPDASPTPSPSPSASPSPSPSATPRFDNDDDDDDDDDNRGPGSGNSGRRRHGSEDDDEAEDHQEDGNDRGVRATFTVTFVTGQVVTGNLVLSHQTLIGDFTFNGVTFNFRTGRQAAANRLANISTRGFVNTGQGQLIGGFIITGGPKTVIIRALGPSLAQQGVSPALANPTLQLFDRNTLLRENDDWQSAANANQLSTSGLAPGNANEAALLIRLEPGAYTTIVSGANNGTGIALVEVYEVGHD